MELVSESRLGEVFPRLAEKIRLMAETLAQQGIAVRVVQSLRTVAEQDALYAQGRTAPGKIVTNCPGGKSYHNFGLAVDLVPSSQDPTQPFAPDWNRQHPTWARMIEAGQSAGLDSGATWRTFKDFPHFQLTGRFPEGEPSAEVHQLYQQGGVQAVWDEVSKSLDGGNNAKPGN